MPVTSRPPQEAASRFLRIPGNYEIRRREGGQAIGGVGFCGPADENGRVTIGYGLIPSARGQGYASEALRGLLLGGEPVGTFPLLRLRVPTERSGLRLVALAERTRLRRSPEAAVRERAGPLARSRNANHL
jgi:hypothetical protein